MTLELHMIYLGIKEMSEWKKREHIWLTGFFVRS